MPVTDKETEISPEVEEIETESDSESEPSSAKTNTVSTPKTLKRAASFTPPPNGGTKFKRIDSGSESDTDTDSESECPDTDTDEARAEATNTSSINTTNTTNTTSNPASQSHISQNIPSLTKRCQWNISPPGQPYRPCNALYVARGRQLGAHINKAHHEEGNPFQCRWKGCTSKATSLHDHFRAGHGQRLFECPTCGAKLSRDDALKRHEQMQKHGRFSRQ
ncbi:hypothetical protein VNI00_017536 [Paramarasmius palmivorus]|uniref:C2H2-type domain-containing protein n=1 Tax=Paramarasmius palmivorus TaxID=297713 RepID=A0AAW0B6K2_9AGAR